MRERVSTVMVDLVCTTLLSLARASAFARPNERTRNLNGCGPCWTDFLRLLASCKQLRTVDLGRSHSLLEKHAAFQEREKGASHGRGSVAVVCGRPSRKRRRQKGSTRTPPCRSHEPQHVLPPISRVCSDGHGTSANAFSIPCASDARTIWVDRM